MKRFFCIAVAPFFFFLISNRAVIGDPIRFPTENRALLEPGGEERFLVPTPGKPCSTGGFGCVRSNGNQMHEGLDIKCLKRDRGGEPADVVMAAASGTVAYINTKPSLSNYGRYVIIRHFIDGLEIYSLYAHLSEVRDNLQAGQPIKSGEAVGVMGRSTNTRTPITKDRAHVHFELDLVLNDHFAQWHKVALPTERNDHGLWNGHNLAGLDPRPALIGYAKSGTNFNLLQWVQSQKELCRVLVRKTHFPFLQRYRSLIVSNPVAEKQGIAAYEISLNFNGVPIRLVPRAESESKSHTSIQLIGVNETEQQKNPCRKLVRKSRGKWELGPNGRTVIEILTF